MDNQAFLIAGVDEVGRGPIAGAVYAAAVILNPEYPIEGLKDSKKLSASRREALFEVIQERALSYAVASASVEEIDQFNILQASLLAMQRAVSGLSIVPDKIVVDGLFCPQVSIMAEAIVNGDSIVPAISAASILAKVSRDREMKKMAQLYPHYGLEKNSGYPTQFHLKALQRYGSSEIHRKTFAPVKVVIGQRQR